MLRRTMYTPIRPQMAPVIAAASSPWRKNSYWNGSNRVSIVPLLPRDARGVAGPHVRAVGNQQQPVLSDHHHFGIVRAAQDRRGEHLLWIALRHDVPIETDHPGEVTRHAVEVVGGQDDRDPFPVQLGEQVEDVM